MELNRKVLYEVVLHGVPRYPVRVTVGQVDVWVYSNQVLSKGVPGYVLRVKWRIYDQVHGVVTDDPLQHLGGVDSALERALGNMWVMRDVGVWVAVLEGQRNVGLRG